MRSAKYILLSALILTIAGVGCQDKKSEVRSAAENMERNKAVKILTDAINAPFEMGEGTGVQGFDIDLGNEIGKSIGMPVEWVKAHGIQRMVELLNAGEAEMIISAMAIDPDRTDIAFSKPYYDTGDGIATLRSELGIKDLASLSGKTAGVAEARHAEKFMATQKTAANVAVKKFKTLDDALGAVNRGELHAVVGDKLIITYGFKTYPRVSLLGGTINSYAYGVVVRKNETDLLAKVNDTIERMKSSGQLATLQTKWFQNVEAESEVQRLSDEKTAALKKGPKAISVTINKTSGAWKMDALDGFQLTLQGASGTYKSDPILTEGNRGTCRFSRPIPPGDYKLNMSPFIKTVTDVPVPEAPKTALSMVMNIGTSGIEISFR